MQGATLRLSLVFPLLAGEHDALAVLADKTLPGTAVANPLGLAFDDLLLAGFEVGVDEVADAELDIAELLGQSLDVVFGGFVTRPHVKVDELGLGRLITLDVKENDFLFPHVDRLGRDIELRDATESEILEEAVVDELVLVDVDTRHGV